MPSATAALFGLTVIGKAIVEPDTTVIGAAVVPLPIAVAPCWRVTVRLYGPGASETLQVYVAG